MQRRVPDGATVVPVILASDKTNLTVLSGGKQAYPVYMTIGNIPAHLRRKGNSGAMVVIAYLPVVKFSGYSTSERRLLLRELFHQCMTELLKPLRLPGQDGVDLECADGSIRRCHPIYSAHLADNQEQVQIACVKGCRCPMCQAAGKLLGVLAKYAPRTTLETAEAIKKGTDVNLNVVSLPYWSSLPMVQLEMLFPPDILHQLLKGMFKDHIFTWCVTAIGNNDEVDQRFKALPQFPGLKQFRSGVTKISQWTGNEFRSMIRVFLGVIINAPHITHNTILAVRAFLDFVFVCHYDHHDNTSLRSLEENLQLFHSLKAEFVEIGGRTVRSVDPGEVPEDDEQTEGLPTEEKTWTIPKLHAMSHYVDMIKMLGSAAHFSTDQSEHMHIQAVKTPYRKSNRRNFTTQIIDRLEMTSRIQEYDEFFHWRESQGLELLDCDVSETASEAGSSEDELQDGPDSSSGTDTANETGGDEVEEDTEFEKGNQATHQFPKRPAQLRVPITQIMVDHMAPDLYRQLQLYYLRSTSGSNPPRRLVGYELDPLPFSHVDLYKQFRVNLPAPPYTPRNQIRLTMKADPKGGQKVRGKPKAYYSVVLVDEQGAVPSKTGIKSASVKTTAKLI
ncbi:hypothetical protein CTheo_8770 [Ceratobasidium theobromae]|uniref:Uncharacterized protein n=1 Tax=Ceratobasidium theobromae TaxID=1582974 RepID=A0A5N5Q8Q9_9AGAM|nr:hypothetical protein CTheo_8770 [Ceratobasidium theobromae]